MVKGRRNSVGGLQDASTVREPELIIRLTWTALELVLCSKGHRCGRPTAVLADLQTQSVGTRLGGDGRQAEAGWEVVCDFGGWSGRGNKHKGCGGKGGERESHG